LKEQFLHTAKADMRTLQALEHVFSFTHACIYGRTTLQILLSAFSPCFLSKNPKPNLEWFLEEIELLAAVQVMVVVVVEDSDADAGGDGR
jgi:hypothetical protein